MSTPKSAPARRRFLALLSGAAAAPAAAALPAIAATTRPTTPLVEESPELLAIGARLPNIAARLQIAKSRMEEAKAAYEGLKPVIPSEIIAPQYQDLGLSELERDIDNEAIQHKGGYSLRYLYDLKKLRVHIIQRDLSRHTKEGRRLRRIARLAVKFERETKAAISASGYGEARCALIRVQIEFQDDFAKAALAIRPQTMTGIGIYAGIVAAGNGSASYNGRPIGRCEALGIAMAEAFGTINGGGAQ